MEFVEGETLEHLIRRSGRVEVKSALEIATQVAAGLAAVHEQNLIHRDIKPSNIMVRLKDDGSITAKIIDLGLAKAVPERSEKHSDADCSPTLGAIKGPQLNRKLVLARVAFANQLLRAHMTKTRGQSTILDSRVRLPLSLPRRIVRVRFSFSLVIRPTTPF